MAGSSRGEALSPVFYPPHSGVSPSGAPCPAYMWLIVCSLSPRSTFLSGLLHIGFSSAGSNGEGTLKRTLQGGGQLNNQDLCCAADAEWERPTQGRGPQQTLIIRGRRSKAASWLLPSMCIYFPRQVLVVYLKIYIFKCNSCRQFSM